MKYARNDLTRLKVIEVFVETPEHPIGSVFPQVLVDEFVPCPDNVEPEWDFNPSTNTYSEPPPPPPGNIVVVECPVAAQHGTAFNVSLKVEVDNGSGTLVPVNATYYVPLKNQTDGTTTQMLVFPLSGGQCTVPVTVSVPGVYEVLMAQILPAPTAKLPDSINIAIY